MKRDEPKQADAGWQSLLAGNFLILKASSIHRKVDAVLKARIFALGEKCRIACDRIT